MTDITVNALLMTNAVVAFNNFRTGVYALGGSATAGPNGDGLVPFPDGVGGTYTVNTLAKQEARITAAVSNATTQTSAVLSTISIQANATLAAVTLQANTVLTGVQSQANAALLTMQTQATTTLTNVQNQANTALSNVSTTLATKLDTSAFTYAGLPGKPTYFPTNTANVAGLSAAIAAATPDWSSLTGKPTTFASTIALVSGLQTALDGKVNTSSVAVPANVNSIAQRDSAGSARLTLDKNAALNHDAALIWSKGGTQMWQAGFLGSSWSATDEWFLYRQGVGAAMKVDPTSLAVTFPGGVSGMMTTNTAQGVPASAYKAFVSFSGNPFASGGQINALEVQSDNTSPPVMSFHRISGYGSYFGLGTDNAFRHGGWSDGSTSYRFWTEKNMGAPSVSAGASTMVQRDGSGYLQGTYINMTDNVVGSGVTGMIVKCGDNYYRTANQAAARTFLNLGSMAYETAGNWMPAGGHASQGVYFNTRVIQNRTAGSDGLYIGYENANGGATRIYGGGATSHAFEVGASSSTFKATTYHDTWLRFSSGGYGIHWEPYGGGLYMADSTWIQVYGGKSILTSGTVQMGQGTVTSDRRLKTDIVPLRSSILDQIEFKEFTKRGVRQYGVIAQEIEAVAPILVTEGGTELEDGTKALTVDYNGLLIACVAELQARVAKLEAA